MLSGMAGHVFISYSHADAGYVQRLAAELEAAGVPVWFDRNLGPGAGWSFEIEDWLRTSAAVVPVVSDMSSRSQWVDREIDFAQELGTPILPIYLGGTVPPRLRAYQHEDGAGGRLPSAEFLRLLAGLSARARATPPPAPVLTAPDWVALEDDERVLLVARGRPSFQWSFLLFLLAFALLPFIPVGYQPLSVGAVLSRLSFPVLAVTMLVVGGLPRRHGVPVCVTDRYVHVHRNRRAVMAHSLRIYGSVTLSHLDPATGTARVRFHPRSTRRALIVYDVPHAAEFVALIQRMIDADPVRGHQAHPLGRDTR
jgi:hypothetical protein